MSADDHEQMRADIWDHIYKSGPQSIEKLADDLQLTQQTVVGLVDHAWFSIQDETVGIAKDGD